MEFDKVKSIKEFIDNVISISNLPKDLDKSIEKEKEFSELIKDISEEDNKLVENYLRELYNKHLFNATNKQNGGKKSRKQKNKKRNTLKRGGTWVDVYDTAQYIVMIGFIGASVLLCILKREEAIAKRRNDEHWANNDNINYPM